MRKVLNNMTIMTLSLLMMVAITNAQSYSSGDDHWLTNEAVTFDTIDLPANAIAPGSKAFYGEVYLKGNPQGSDQYDTRIKRVSSVNVPGSTSLVVEDLNMVSVAPLDVEFTNGPNQNCTMYSSISDTAVSNGTMQLKADNTFSSTLNIIPKLTFSCVSQLADSSSKATVTVLDLGSPMVQFVMQKRAAEARERIKSGNGTERDLVATQACQIEAEPYETGPKQTGTNARTTTRAPQPAPSCGIKLSGGGTTRNCGGGLLRITGTFNPELALLAKHGVFPWWPPYYPACP